MEIREKFTLVTIEPTNGCNLQCEMCYARDSDRPIGYMDYEKFTQIIDELDSLSAFVSFA